ncbi:hypothetical protein AB4254_11035 [Vibrio breoganii]
MIVKKVSGVTKKAFITLMEAKGLTCTDPDTLQFASQLELEGYLYSFKILQVDCESEPQTLAELESCVESDIYSFSDNEGLLAQATAVGVDYTEYVDANGQAPADLAMVVSELMFEFECNLVSVPS